ncbi:MAG: tetratricopeptide repeat protein [SAR324 cluster bacterium]|nr:tetratricopeptide repeat protein [SAR324 cluster bacterium]
MLKYFTTLFIATVFSQTLILGADSLVKSLDIDQAKADFTVISKAINNNFRQSAYSLGFDFITKYPSNEHFSEVLYLLTTLGEPNQKLINYFTTQIQPNLVQTSFLESSQIYYISLALLNFDKPKLALSYQTIFFKNFPSHIKASELKFKTIEILFHKQRWQLISTQLTNINEFSFNKEQREFLKKIKLLLKINLKDGSVSAKELKNILSDPRLDTDFKIDFLIKLAQKSYKNKKIKKSLRYFKQAKGLDFQPEQLLKIDVAYAALVFDRYSQAKPVLENEQINQAIKIFTININHKNPIDLNQSLLAIGWLQHLKGLDELAKTNWLRYSNSAKNDDISEVSLLLADLYQSQKNWSKANEILDTAIINASEPEKKARIILQKMRNTLTANICNKLPNEAKKTEWQKFDHLKNEAYLILGECFYKLGEFTTALNYFEKIDITSLELKTAFKSYFSSLLKTNQPKKAGNLLAQIVETHKVFANSALHHAKEALSAKKFVKLASSIFKKYENFNWSNQEYTLWQLFGAHIKFIENKPQDAEKILTALLSPKRQQNYTDQMISLIIDSWLSSYQNKPNQKVKAYDRLLKLEFSSSIKLKLYLNAGQVWYDHLKKPRQAREKWLPLLTAKNSEYKISAISLITETYIYENNITKAEKFLATNIKQVPKDNNLSPNLWLRLAQIYHNQKKSSKALKAYKKVISLHPNTKEAKEAKKAKKSIPQK